MARPANATAAVAETLARLGVKATVGEANEKFGRISLKEGSKYMVLVNTNFGVTLYKKASTPTEYTPWTMDLQEFTGLLAKKRIVNRKALRSFEAWKLVCANFGVIVKKVTVSKSNAYYQAIDASGRGIVGFFNQNRDPAKSGGSIY